MKTPSRLRRMVTGWGMIAALSVTGVASAQNLGKAAPAPAAPKGAALAPAGQDDKTTQLVRGALRISDFTTANFTTIPQFGTPDEAVLRVRLGGDEYDLVVTRFSMRSRDFRVLTTGANGKHEEVQVEAPITFRGSSVQDQGAIVRVSILDGRVEGTVILSNGAKWGIHPMSDIAPEVPIARHVIYQASDIYPSNKRCPVEAAVGQHEHAEGEGEGEGVRGTVTEVADMAMEVDNPYYVLLGSNVQSVVNDVEATMNSVETIYENDCDITYEITTIHIWTDAADPYSGTVASGILDQFQDYWNGNFTGIRRDVAHMFTGTNLNDPVIGIALLSTVCNTGSAYGLVQSRWSLNGVTRACLSAHELGHNWSAPHCDGNPNCNIMCSGLGGCSGICTSFGVSAATIVSFRNSRGCLTELPGALAFPFSDNFASISVDPVKWTYSFGASHIDSPIPGAPSPNRVLRLNSASAGDFADDEIRTNFILAASQPAIQLKFYYARRNVEAGKTLTVMYWANNLRWNTLETITSDGITSTGYTLETLTLPNDADHNQLRIRLRVDGTQADDEWFIDDLYVGEPVEDPVPLPLVDTFPSILFDATVWSIFQGDINTIALAEPSAPNAAELDGSSPPGEQIWTKPLLAAGMQDVTISYYVERRGVDAGESLVIEARDDTGTWNAVHTIVSTGPPDQSTFTQFTHVLNTANYLYNGLRIRWRSVCNNAGDNWFVDDISITGTPTGGGPECPADWDGNGVVNSTDVSDFINDWFQDQVDGTLVTDWDDNGVVNSTDVSNFINEWLASPIECGG